MENNDIIEPQDAPEALQTEKLIVTTPLDISNLPESVWSGTIGKVADIVGERSWKVLMGALSSRQAMIGRKISARYRDAGFYGQTFMLLTGDSGTGKGLVMNIISTSTSKHIKLCKSVESSQAMVHVVGQIKVIDTGETKITEGGKKKKITKTSVIPTPAILMIEELTSLLKTTTSASSKLDQALCELFQKTGTYEVVSQRNMSDFGDATLKVEWVELSIAGTLIASQFREFFNKDRQVGGLLNRFLILPEDTFKREKFYSGTFDPDKMACVFDELRARKNIVSGQVNAPLYLTPSALAIYDDIYDTLFNTYKDTSESSPYNRLQLHFYIIAAGYAYDAGRYDCIDRPDAEAAAAIIRSYHAALVKLLDPAEQAVVKPYFVDYNDKIIDKVLSYVSRRPGLSARDIAIGLQKLGNSDAIKKALAILSDPEMGKIEIRQGNNDGKYKYKINCYYPRD